MWQWDKYLSHIWIYKDHILNIDMFILATSYKIKLNLSVAQFDEKVRLIILEDLS